MIDLDGYIRRFERFPGVVRALVVSLTDEEARYKPEDSAWSILEVFCHLADEEVEDFRTRVRMTLEDPTQSWPGIDPEGSAIERGYNEMEMEAVLSRFERERACSVQWLRTLRDPDWSQEHEQGKLGKLRAGDVLVSWAAHDALHLRQIAKRLYQICVREGGEFRTDYAGSWSL